jgi:hypothetical protein
MVKKPFSRLIKILTDVYTDGEAELSRLERFAHFCTLVVRSFVRNRCFVRASALSYTTLLALIPLLAVAAACLKRKARKKFTRRLTNWFPSSCRPQRSTPTARRFRSTSARACQSPCR